MDIYNKTKQYITDLFDKAGDLKAIKHHLDTDRWLLELNPNADEALRTAAISHDVERAVYGDWKKGSMDSSALKKHQKQSSEIMEKFLRSEDAGESFINRVKYLISAHEEGGDKDQNLLCDADVLAFLEDKALPGAKPQTKEKLDYLLDRLHFEKAKEIGLKYYTEAIKNIEKSSNGRIFDKMVII